MIHLITLNLINNYKLIMGNTWKGISDDDLNEAEINLLTRAGLKTEEY